MNNIINHNRNYIKKKTQREQRGLNACITFVLFTYIRLTAIES